MISPRIGSLEVVSGLAYITQALLVLLYYNWESEGNFWPLWWHTLIWICIKRYLTIFDYNAESQIFPVVVFYKACKWRSWCGSLFEEVHHNSAPVGGLHYKSNLFALCDCGLTLCYLWIYTLGLFLGLVFMLCLTFHCIYLMWFNLVIKQHSFMLIC